MDLRQTWDIFIEHLQRICGAFWGLLRRVGGESGDRLTAHFQRFSLNRTFLKFVTMLAGLASMALVATASAAWLSVTDRCLCCAPWIALRFWQGEFAAYLRVVSLAQATEIVDRRTSMLPPVEGSGAPVAIHNALQVCERRGFKAGY